jgi:F-type H+-transporting ATPase subunit gamma
VLATGRKLHGSLNGNPCVTAFLEGASVVEEVETVLTHVVDTLMALQKQHGVLSLSALYHVIDNNAVVRQDLLPPFQVHCQRRAEVSISPVLNLTPELFLIELSHHYLYASLHEIFYASLMAENHQRIRHLEGAVKHLEEKVETLQRQANTRRQEEIIEEIEVLLLSTAGKTNNR